MLMSLRTPVVINTNAPSKLHPNKCEKADFFLRVQHAIQSNSHDNADLHENALQTPALRFYVDKIRFENKAFRKQWHHENHVISLTEFFSNTNSK